MLLQQNFPAHPPKRLPKEKLGRVCNGDSTAYGGVTGDGRGSAGTTRLLELLLCDGLAGDLVGPHVPAGVVGGAGAGGVGVDLLGEG